MAIYRVSGQMLQSTLVRDGNSIAFANTASSTATLFVDIANSRVGVNSNVANVTLDVQGNIFALNLSSTGNITAANINGTVVSATGNVIGGNVRTAGLITATGNITGGNVLTGGLISATSTITSAANITGGNILTGGLISATGNLTAGNVNTILVSATGNVNAGNVVVGNILIPSTGNVTLGNVNINYLSTPVANSDAATKGYVDTSTSTAFGNITVSNTTISTSLANGNITLAATGTQLVQVSGNLGLVLPNGNTTTRPSPALTGTIRFNTTTTQLEIWDGTQWVSATNNTSVITNQTVNGDGTTVTFSLNQSATAESILVSINGVLQTPSVDYTTSIPGVTITFTTAPAAGDVIQIRFIAATTTLSGLQNGTSNVSIPTSGGNVTIGVAGTANVLTVASTGANIVGYANITGNISTGNISTAGLITVTGNITGGNVSTNTLLVGNIVNSNANGVGNIGNATTYFNTVFAKATSAQYADLAEFYAADAVYEPGTVVSFGGEREITISTVDADPCVAGVVSTNPSYIMNAGIFCEFPTQVALTGRVPCRVIGSVTKGAMMVADGTGCARAEKTPAMGTVIGKALEDFAGKTGVIEVVVGRL
jgi:Phage T7 tail fibre protein